jgi:tetratricopeptide (TPR) repeat protein
MTNPWDGIFLSDFEGAYKIANENYLSSAGDFDLRARATCSLLLCQYNNALEDFLILQEIERNTRRVSDGTYMNIALCYYAIDDIEKAIDYFKFPVTIEKELQYTSDISVPPCILYYIALKLQRPEVLKIAVKGLKRLKQMFPTFLLGELSETDLNSVYQQQTHETLRNRKQCKVEFYKAVKSLQKGDINNYSKHLKRCVDLTGKFMEFEYYLAKLEHERLNSR